MRRAKAQLREMPATAATLPLEYGCPGEWALAIRRATIRARRCIARQQRALDKSTGTALCRRVSECEPVDDSIYTSLHFVLQSLPGLFQ